MYCFEKILNITENNELLCLFLCFFKYFMHIRDLLYSDTVNVWCTKFHGFYGSNYEIKNFTEHSYEKIANFPQTTKKCYS